MCFSLEQISKWKEKYGKIFKVCIEDKSYVYRRLNIGELSLHLNNNVLDVVKEDEIVRSTLLYPSLDFDIEPAGIITFLYNCVIMSTGFFNVDDIFNLVSVARNAIDHEFESDIMTWKLAIIQIFTGYTFDILDNMSLFEFFKLVVLCEKVTGQKLFSFTEKGNNPKIKNKKVKEFTESQLKQVAAADDAAVKLRNAYKKGK